MSEEIVLTVWEGNLTDVSVKRKTTPSPSERNGGKKNQNLSPFQME